jgi:ubiquinone/menaquinone biosynthesis C-methylase UbiE
MPHSELPHFGTAAKTAADVDAVLPFLEAQDAVLDVGCGWGRICLKLRRRGYDVWGVDLSLNLIRYAQNAARASGVTDRFEVGSMLSLPYGDQAFDKILCMWGVFSHLLNREDQMQALNEMHRVLRPGGLSFVEFGNGESKHYQKLRESRAFGPDERVFIRQDGEIPNTLYIHDRQTLLALADQSAFGRYEVKFKNINHRRRLVMTLHR